MKNIKSNLIPLAFLGTALLFGCQKEGVKTSSANVSSPGNESFATTDGVTQTLTLRPGANKGQDAYVEYKSDDAGTANVNFNYVAELPPQAWTDGGANVIQRIFINFTGLSAIPTTATITSATLFLYGLDNSLNAPQGNSSYPGSPYTLYGPNRCVVDRVTSAWDENTITWNTQPSFLTDTTVKFGPSTTQWNWDAKIKVTGMVQKMVAKPNKNFGFAIKLLQEQIYKGIVFGSSEAGANDKPKLVVEYTL